MNHIYVTLLTIFLFNSFAYGQSVPPDTALTVTSDGHVGIGTSIPKARLHVFAPEGSHGLWIRAGDGAEDVLFHVEDSDGTVQAMHIDDSGNVGIGITEVHYPLEMESGAYVTEGGVWTNAASRQQMSSVSTLTQHEADSVLTQLTPVKYTIGGWFIEEEHVGFIAEDVPDLVVTNDRKGLSPMDIVAVLTKVVQHQQKRITELDSLLRANQ